MKQISKVVIAIALMTLTSGAVLAQNGNDLFQQALVKERTEGNFTEAIKLYQTIVQKYASDHKLAAKALLQMGQAYEKLGNVEARNAYERIARDFADQKETAAEALTRLAALDAARSSVMLTAKMLWSGSDVDFGASLIPDGRLLMTDWSTGDLAFRNMATGQVKRLMVKAGSWSESGNYAGFPVLSSDLRQVAYTWWDESIRSLQLRAVNNEIGGKQRVLIRNAEWEFSYFEPSGWSQDGKSVLVNLWRKDGTKQIAWVSASDGTIKVLQSLDWRLREGRSSLSPDGRYVAYSAWAGTGFKDSVIHLVAADGSAESLLTKGGGFNGDPVWAPDGRHVVYLSDRKGSLGLWSVEIQNGQPQGQPTLVKSDVGRISPIGFTRTGSYYYARSEGTRDVFVADLDPATGKIRGHEAVTQKFVGSNLTPVWSPDGKFIVFHSQRLEGDSYPSDVVVHSVETGEERTYAMHMMRLAGNPMWFRDGKALLQGLRDQQSRVFFYRVDLKTGEFKQLVATDGTSGSVESALSPDETTVYTNVGVGNRGSPAIRAFDLATGQERQIFAVKDGRIPGLGLSPDGQTLALKIFYPEKHETHLGVVGIDGKNFRDLYVDTADQDRVRPQLLWTKDGHTILFTKYTVDQWQLMRIPANGGKPEFTGFAGKGVAGIHMNPDGSRIAFNDDASGVGELWTLDNLPILKAAR